METIEQKRLAALARIAARRQAADEQAARAANLKAMRDAGAYQVLLIAADLPLVRSGGNALRDLREDVFDAAYNANGRAGVHGIGAVFACAMMGGEPFALWN